MKIDLSLCDSIPYFYSSVILFTEYVIILFLIIYRINSATLKKYPSKEVSTYHALCILTCLMRILSFSYAVLQYYITIPIYLFYILVLITPFPFISAISILTGTWVKMYLLLCSYNQIILKKYYDNLKFGLLFWNSSLYAIVGLLIYLIYARFVYCKCHLGDFFICFVSSCDILSSCFLVFIGIKILVRIKKLTNTMPHRLLAWNLVVFFISFFRGLSLLLQIFKTYDNIQDDPVYFSVFYIGILNLFEIIPILVFLKAIMVSAIYMKSGADRNAFESTSMSSLINGIVASDDY